MRFNPLIFNGFDNSGSSGGGGGTPGGATGSIQFNQAGAFAGDAAHLYWDSTNHRLGIGTSSPAQALSVVGTIESTSGGFKFPDTSVQTVANNFNPASTNNILPATDNLYTLGNLSAFPATRSWLSVNARTGNFGTPSQIISISGQNAPAKPTGFVTAAVYTPFQTNEGISSLAVFTSSTTTNNTGTLYFETGNTTGSGTSGGIYASTGTTVNGNSGSITLTPGLPSGTGIRGSVQIQDGSEGSANKVWISKDTSGSGKWDTSGASGTFTTADAKTVTVTNGLITSIV